MNQHLPIETGARFMWRDTDGAMRVGVGRTRNISRNGLFVEADSVPVPGADIQVVLDPPSELTQVANQPLMGKGVVVRTESTSDGKSGFAAHLLFEPGLDSVMPQLEKEPVDVSDSCFMAPAYNDDAISEFSANSISEGMPPLPVAVTTAPEAPDGARNLRAGRVFAVVALLLLMFGGRISHRSDALSHRTSFDMSRSPYHANVSTW